MRITRIILHALFLILGVLILLEVQISEKVANILPLILSFYALGILLFSVIRELILMSFPRHIGVMLVLGFLVLKLITKDYLIFSEDKLLSYITQGSAIIAAYFLIIAILGNSLKFSTLRIKAGSYNSYYRINYFLYITIAVLAVTFYFISPLGENGKNWQYSLAILLALFPFFNKNFVKKFAGYLQILSDKFKLDISFNQLGKLAKVRNFVFAKEKLIESKEYQIVEVEYRATVRVNSVVQLALKLASDWNPKYQKLFVSDEYEKKPMNYAIVEQNNNGICVIDDDATMYHFGTYAFVKDKVKYDNKSNLYLLKNSLPIAKYIINEKIANEKVELVNQLDYFGNTILFNPGIKEDLGRDYSIVFDRVYSNLSEEKQQNLLLELNKKAPTAFITAKDPTNLAAYLSFYLTTKTDIKKNNSIICCNSKSLLAIPLFILYAKRVHTFIKYSLLTSIIIQLLLIVFAFLNYESLALIVAFNLGFATLAEIFTALASKKLNQLPDHPANRDQSHHAA